MADSRINADIYEKAGLLVLIDIVIADTQYTKVLACTLGVKEAKNIYDLDARFTSAIDADYYTLLSLYATDSILKYFGKNDASSIVLAIPTTRSGYFHLGSIVNIRPLHIQFLDKAIIGNSEYKLTKLVAYNSVDKQYKFSPKRGIFATFRNSVRNGKNIELDFKEFLKKSYS